MYDKSDPFAADVNPAVSVSEVGVHANGYIAVAASHVYLVLEDSDFCACLDTSAPLSWDVRVFNSTWLWTACIEPGSHKQGQTRAGSDLNRWVINVITVIRCRRRRGRSVRIKALTIMDLS